MEILTKKQDVTTLRKGSELYDIIIPEQVQMKIHKACLKVYNVEWSGTLFYKVEGEFDDKDNPLKVKVLDFFVQDIGTSAYTEFSQSPELVTYMCDNPELLEEDVFMGLIHSHNNMGTFFSGTDQETLRTEGGEKHHFVSLIVNNAGKYTAAVTRKVSYNQSISENLTYFSFFNKNKTMTRTRNVVTEEVEWFTLNIHIEGSGDYKAFEDRIDEMIKIKQRVTLPGAPVNTNYGYGYGGVAFKTSPTSAAPAQSKIDFPQNNFKTPTLEPTRIVPDNSDNFITKGKEEDEFDPFNIEYGAERFDPEEIEKIVRQLLTGSVLVANDRKLDLDKFVKTSTHLFDNRFIDIDEFSQWAEQHLDFLILEAYDETLFQDHGEDAMRAVCAYDLIERLQELPDSPYIE